MHYYNEFDPGAAAWLRNLMDAGEIPYGVVDTKSIVDVKASEIAFYTQVHLFAGIGGWALAAKLAGWPDHWPLWTASFPCQPFSNAGLQNGIEDARHLWPNGLQLIRANRPPVIVGEQVASSLGYGWFDGVQFDLESEGYAARAVDIPACAIGAAHQRNRLYWVAIDTSVSFDREQGVVMADALFSGRDAAAHSGIYSSEESSRSWNGDLERLHGANRTTATTFGVGDVADTKGEHSGRNIEIGGSQRRIVDGRDDASGSSNGALGNTINPRLERYAGDEYSRSRGSIQARPIAPADVGEFIICHDGKARRTKPGLPMLVDGVSGTVVVSHANQSRNIHRNTAWKGFGNAIVPQLGAQVLAALMECLA